MSEQLKLFLEAAQYRITEGSEFMWSCYGPNARYLDTSDGESIHSSVIFDSKTHVLYEVHVTDDEDNHLPYRWINPEFFNAYKAEAESRSIDYKNFIDDIKWADTDTFEDIIEKVQAIYAGEPYDPRVVLSIDMPDDLFALCNEAAKERGISFNRFIEIALEEAVEEAKKIEEQVDNKA